jgi:IMP cyclohydrolase
MKQTIEGAIGQNPYPGRGVLLGQMGNYAVAVYFIMGRSQSSRNRIFAVSDDGIVTKAYAPGEMENPSLLLYAPVRSLGDTLIVTNGDQTDTIYEKMEKGGSFAWALHGREYEPDEPHYTPRISGILQFQEEETCSYTFSILKRGEGGVCLRHFFEYESGVPGLGHLIHTYEGDGNPLPAFQGEPKAVTLEGPIDVLTDTLWNALNEENKVSLFVRYVDMHTGETETRIINKREGK